MKINKVYSGFISMKNIEIVVEKIKENLDHKRFLKKWRRTASNPFRDLKSFVISLERENEGLDSLTYTWLKLEDGSGVDGLRWTEKSSGNLVAIERYKDRVCEIEVTIDGNKNLEDHKQLSFIFDLIK